MARFYCTTCKCSTLRFMDFSGFILQDSSFNEFEWSGFQFGFKKTISLNPFTPKSDSTDFTLSNRVKNKVLMLMPDDFTRQRETSRE